jgi:serine/threonine protein kinase
VVTPRRWQQIERLFHDALDRPVEERAAFLDRSCAGDESLRREVNALLDSPASANRFLDRGALEVAAGLVSASTTPVLAGQRLGVYQLQERIGSGGMGDVYRAHDTRLGRDVAIKILPHGFSADPSRQARFEREARVLAALNHPNIGAVYGFEEGVTESGETVRGIVLELIEGETLSERVRRGPLPVGEALVIAKQIADALDVAHEKGIVHRDLKPANIKIAPDGVVKVLDFGLAKTIADNAAFTQSVAPDNTVEGAILGTAAYMSPEQARGQSVDKRTDIWAFGSVLYEMLTGHRAFAGDSLTDTLAHVIEREPDWRAVPETTPEAVRRLLERCLRKDVRRRLRDIADARIEIDDAIAAPTAPRDGTPGVSDRRLRGPSRRWAPIGWIAALVLASAMGIARRPWINDYFWQNPLADARPVRLTDFEGEEVDAAISPDGKFTVFLSNRDGPLDVFVSQIGSGAFTNLTKGNFRSATWGMVRLTGFSGDGEQVWFMLGPQPGSTDTSTLMGPTMGGMPKLFLERGSNPTWSPDGKTLAYYKPDPGDPIFVADRNASNPRESSPQHPACIATFRSGRATAALSISWRGRRRPTRISGEFRLEVEPQSRSRFITRGCRTPRGSIPER